MRRIKHALRRAAHRSREILVIDHFGEKRARDPGSCNVQGQQRLRRQSVVKLSPDDQHQVKDVHLLADHWYDDFLVLPREPFDPASNPWK